MTDKESAKLDPSKVYKNPREILSDEALSKAEKIDILQRWAYDERELSVAEEENMRNTLNHNNNPLNKINKYFL